MIYIDDSPDISLSKYLDKFRSDLCQFDYSDIEFNSEEGYESLIIILKLELQILFLLILNYLKIGIQMENLQEKNLK